MDGCARVDGDSCGPGRADPGRARNGQFYADGVEAGREKILSMVEEARKAGHLVRLDGDVDTLYQYIVELVSLCRMRGVNNVKLHLRDPNKPGP